MPRVRKVIRGSNGEATDYVLTNGRRLTRSEGVKLADRGGIAGTHSVHPKRGRPFLRTHPDGVKKNNLENL